MSRLLWCFLLPAFAPIGSIALNFRLVEPSSVKPRVLLYVTTYNSNEHWTFMKCQVELYARMTELKEVDVLLNVGETDPPGNDDLSHEEWQSLIDAWPTRQRRKPVSYRYNPGKQAGAKKAMHDALSEGWFNGYDWVIRINPDVIIYDERPLFSLLQEERNWAVVMKCGDSQTHTDFMAFRPEHLAKDAFSNWTTFPPDAESQANTAFAPIYDTGNYAYLKPNAPQKGCHLQDGGIYHGMEGTCVLALQKMGWKDSFGSQAAKTTAKTFDAWQEAWRPNGSSE